MQKIIGLDIGSYSIKSVEIINSFNSYSIGNFCQKVIPYPDIHPNTLSEAVSIDDLVADCIKDLFEFNHLAPDRVVTAMPGQHTTSRILTFPFSDASKIAASIEFSVEDKVPFALEDIIIDHQILNTSNKQTKVLVVMVIKKYLANFLGQLSKVNIDPKLVDIDSLSLYNLAFHLPQDDQNNLIGIVDIGHEKTSVCILDNGNLRIFRTLKVGGKYITEVLARNNEISFLQAQELKHQVNTIGIDQESIEPYNLTPEHSEIALQIGLAGYSFANDLVRTFQGFKTEEKKPISCIYLSGGTTKLRGIEHYLQQQLFIDVKKLDISQCDLKIDPDLNKHSIIIPQALSIGLRVVAGSKKISKINLRKGQFAYSHDSQMILDVVSRVVKWTSATIGLLVIGFICQYIFYTHQINKFDQAYRKKVSSVFPKLELNLSQYKNFQSLSGFIEQTLKLQIASLQSGVSSFVSGSSSSPALAALKELSQLITKDINVEFVSYEFSPGNENSGALKILGETDGHGSVSKITELITSHNRFVEVTEKSDYKPGSDGKVILFTIHSKFIYDTSLM